MSGSTAAVRRIGRRGFSVAAVFAMVAVWLPALSFTSVANAADPVQVQMTLEGCRRPAPAAACAYGDDFTTGNLGKNWAELDYVPHRLTLHNNGANQTFQLRLSSDHLLNGVVGYDFIKAGWDDDGVYTTNSAPMFSNGCGGGAHIVTGENSQPSPPGVVGGVDKVITTEVEVTMAAGADCLISYQVRLGIGSHLYSGSSLQSQVLEDDYESIGQRTVSIPVKEIAPQVAEIDASASRTNDYTWDITKVGDGPLTINTCEPDATEPNANYTVSYTRTKDAGDNYVVEGTVTLTNPSTRTLTTHSIAVTIEDSDGSADVNAVVDDETITVPMATSGGPGTATADFTAIVPAPIGTLTASSVVTYDDPDKPGVLLPGLESNSVPVDITVNETDSNATADLSDTESFTGTNANKFEYKRTAPHATSGFTTGDTFTDNNLDASGSFDIHKIVRVTEPGNFSANLHNVVTITPDDGGDPDTAIENIAITATADDPVVTIKKSVDIAPESDATFDFTITSNDDDSKFWTTSVTIKAGDLAGDSDPVTVDPSASGYTLDETAAAGYDAVNTSIGALDFCDTKDVPVSDSRQLGHVKVEKVLDGQVAGADTHFVFDVVCDNGYTTTLEVDGAGSDQTDDVIPTGVDCTITEQDPPTGWENTGSDPSDGGVESAQDDSSANTVEITNTRLLGHITVDKSLVGDVAGAPTTFTFDWNCDAFEGYAGDSGQLQVDGEGTASTADVIPTGVECTVTETDIDGHWTLTSTSPEDGSATAAQGEDSESNTVFFENTRNVGNITVNKTRVGQVAGASTVFVFDIVCADFPEYNEQLVIDTAESETASATSGDIPTDVACTVTEEGTSGWQQTTPASGGVDVTVPGEASFTNTRLEGPLQLIKSVTPETGSYNPADDNNTLTYTLTLDEPEPGQLDHTDVVVSDYIPGYDPDHTDSLKTTYVADSATCSTGCTATYDADAHTLTWAVGDFNHDDDPVVFTFQVTIDQPEAAANGGIPAGVVDNIGAVQSLQQPKTPSNLVETPVIAVLPVRHERTPPKVLPFTGNSLPIKSAMILGMVLITAGVALTVRRRREH